MGKALIIVESPAKIKTLKQLLGNKFVFQSSFGHIRDLPASEFGVDLENAFEPKYVMMPDKKDVIGNLKKAAKDCDIVYLSPDPDREGEAIAWHISEILPKTIPIKRVAFNSITKDAVREALQNPHDIDMALVNAQQARRVLDRLVGYSISPLLNRRLRRGKGKAVSAGRVQSVALKLVVDREKEIEAFIPKEYWVIEADLKPETRDRTFTAFLFSIDGKKVEKETVEGKTENVDFVLISNEEKAKKVVEDLKKAPYKVASIERKERKRNPEAPFITSTLQQEASRHHRFSPARTMQIAQSLYEGVDLGADTEGLITYMRTDSVRIAPEALHPLRDYIKNEYGEEYLSDGVRAFTVKKSAQDAHEAIRPTNLEHNPEAIKEYLTHEQYLLYSLIWKRYVACQMAQAIYDTVSCDIQAGSKYILRATGSIIKFPGFLKLYEEKEDEAQEKDDKMLPDLTEDELLNLLKLHNDQSFTRPPPRFTEASLVKELEKSGIGRPSTYAAIMKKIESRDYTTKEQGRLKPTELGRLITEMLEVNFQVIMNIGFTALMEDELELVAENKKDWKNLLGEFWKGFHPTLTQAEETAFVPKLETAYLCPKCGGKLQKIWAKSKYFLGCSNYPDCDYTTSQEEFTFNKEEYAEDFKWDQMCPTCSSEMKIRFGKFGPFLGCSKYPDCKGIVNIPKKGESAEQEAVSCPATGCVGKLVKRRSRFGKMFYSCSEYPACDVIGNEIENVIEKYTGRPKTAYVKQTKQNQKRRPDMAMKKTASSRKSSTTKKTAARKPAAKKKTASKRK